MTDPKPEEVEHALRTHPDIHDAVVIRTAGGRLVAHLLTGDDPPTEARLRAHLSDRLPPTTIPDRFVLHAEPGFTGHS